MLDRSRMISLKTALGKSCCAVLGRRNTVRLARFLLNYARLDVPNDMEDNGELLVQDVMLRYMPEGRIVVFDVGANLGLWSSSLLHRAAARGRNDVDVHLFEPSSATYQMLADRIQRDPLRDRLHAVPLAVSDTEGEATFYSPAPGAGTSSLYRHATLPASLATETIRTCTLEGYCAARKLRSVFFVKSDAEGNDFRVLQGARALLERKEIELLQFEYNHRWITARFFLRDAFELAAEHGYLLGKITPRGIEFYPEWDPELESFQEANYLVCRPHWRSRFPEVSWWKTP